MDQIKHSQCRLEKYVNPQANDIIKLESRVSETRLEMWVRDNLHSKYKWRWFSSVATITRRRHPAKMTSRGSYTRVFADSHILPFVVSFFRSSRDNSWRPLLQQGVGHQLQGSLRVGDDPLDGLELVFHWVDGGVLGHDVAVIRGVGPTHTRLQGGGGGTYYYLLLS